jgi:hypothetical protein
MRSSHWENCFGEATEKMGKEPQTVLSWETSHLVTDFDRDQMEMLMQKVVLSAH